ncbi:MAG: hypothetical protein RBR18_11345 [Desulfovibrionaceae bacterium]|nr:hypothetical protein [Desulfovibrionaceae bacterium]
MSVRASRDIPSALAYLPDLDRYRFFELYDGRGVYGFGALAEGPDNLEAHLELSRFGPRVLRSLQGDALWLRAEAARLGKSHVLALRADLDRPDPRWPKFTRLMGFTGQMVVQVARLDASAFAPFGG